jgi:hypothetical protein
MSPTIRKHLQESDFAYLRVISRDGFLHWLSILSIYFYYFGLRGMAIFTRLPRLVERDDFTWSWRQTSAIYF